MIGNLVIQIDGRRWFGELLTNDEMDGKICLGSCRRGVNQVGVCCIVVTRRPNSALDALRLFESEGKGGGLGSIATYDTFVKQLPRSGARCIFVQYCSYSGAIFSLFYRRARIGCFLRGHHTYS